MGRINQKLGGGLYRQCEVPWPWEVLDRDDWEGYTDIVWYPGRIFLKPMLGMTLHSRRNGHVISFCLEWLVHFNGNEIVSFHSCWNKRFISFQLEWSLHSCQNELA